MTTKLSSSYWVDRGNHSPLAEQALVRVKALSLEGVSVGVGLCLENVRKQYDIAADGTLTAFIAWQHSMVKPDATHTFYKAPAGVPVFWSGGSAGDGHIAIADGHGNVWSTDILRPAKWDLVPLGLIASKWNLKPLGWSSRLNGVTVCL